MKITKLLQSHINAYGNVDIILCVPKGLTHIEYDPLLKTLSIPYARALTGFSQKRYPILSGVVIDTRHLSRFNEAQNEKKLSEIQKSEKQLSKIASEMSIELVGQALYVVNKYAKEDKRLYHDKERTLRYFPATELHVNTFKGEVREYVIRRNYEDEDEYDAALMEAIEDEQGRPYISGGIQPQTRMYLYYEVGGFGFHSPTEFKPNNLPEKQIGEGLPFVAPRGIDLEKLGKRISLKRAKMILNVYSDIQEKLPPDAKLKFDIRPNLCDIRGI